MLSLAMVLTSVNVPALTVRAEEETPVVNEDDAATMLPEENAGDDVTAPSEETGDEDTTAPSDEAGDDETTAPSEDVENQAPSNPSEGDDDSSEGIEGVEPSDPSDDTVDNNSDPAEGDTDPKEEPGGSDARLASPTGVVAQYWLNNDANKGKIRIVWGEVTGAVKYKIQVDGTFVKEVESAAEQFLDNTWEEGEHTVTIIAVDESGNQSPASEVTSASKFTVPGATETKAPSAPLGVVAGYFADEGDNKGKIKVEWGSDFGTGGLPTSWKVYIDSKLVGTETSAAAYFYNNTYAEGTHTAKVVAVNDIGDSAPTKVTFKLTAEQAGGTDVDEGEPVGTGDTLVSSEIDLTDLVPATDNSEGTNAGIWSAWTNAGITAKGAADSTVTFTYPSGKCTTDWALQFQTDESIDIVEGEYYTLTFTAESSIPRTMEVCMGISANGARHNDLKYKLPGKQATEVVYVFEAAATAKCKIQFLLGAQQDDNSPLWEQEGGHTLKLSRISLVEGKAVAEIGANETVAGDADKSGLNAAIAACEALDAEDYEEESYGVLTTTLAAAKAVSENNSATKKDADVALADLQIAQALLREAGYVPPADPVTMVDPINFEELEMKTYRSQDDGGWGGDSNVQFSFDKTTATISADSFGNPASWGVQWATIAKLESPVENNVFEFDVVSTTDKSFVYKNENTQATETIELKAGETAHIARRINGKSFGFTFDLSGGEGTLTFTNMKFGEEVSYYNFKEQSDAGNVELYVGTDWAGAEATGNAEEDSYTIQAAKAGNDQWGIQLMLKNFIDVKTTAAYKIGVTIESTVDKDITVKLGNPDNENDVLAQKDISLTADAPRTIELESELWKEELASTLYFACGGGNNGNITISKLYVVSKKPTAKAAPVVTTGRKNDKANGYRIGEAVVLKYNDDAEDWAGSITAVTVNSKPLAADKYALSAAEKTITVGAGVFTKYDVYDFVISAENYEDVKVRVPVYDPSVDNEDWQKEWADEFDGTALDATKWDYEIGIRSGDDATSNAAEYWGNNEKQYYTKEAVTVQDGKLVITATALTDELKAKYNITDSVVKYSSGRIRTVSEDGSDVKYGTTYGRMEAMMELPQATGYWPAFWGLPTPETIDLYGGWAASGELDIMEAVGQDGNYVNGTIHYGSEWPGNVYSGGSHYFEENDSIENAHLYAVEWEPGEIRWYVDDILYHVENNWYAKAPGASSNYAYPAPFDEDFYLLLNLAVGGNYVSNKEPSADELGRSMKVDYVRVYKDANTDYGTTPDAPSADKDVDFFEANKIHADESGNYIKDRDFTTLKDHQMNGGTSVVPGLGYWSSATETANGASTDIAVADRDGVKYAKIDVKKQGANNYDVQLIQNVPLAKGYTYKLSFDAYTDVPAGRNFTIAPKGDADNGWAGYDSGISANLKADVQSFEHIFKMASPSDPTARIEMNIGNALGTVYVGNVRLVALSDKEVEDLENEKLHGKKKPLDNGEHVYNGGFDQGNNRLVYWDLEGDYKADTSKRSMRAVINASSAIGDATLKQTGLQLLARDTYRLTMKVKADADKKIKVGLYSKEGVVYGLTQEMVGTEEKEVVLEFTMPDDVTDEEAVLIISFGGNTIPVEIDNVSMFRTTNFNAVWNASILYPLGGETWADYSYFVNENTTQKKVPADGIITEAAKGSKNNYDYMIFRNASVKTGYTYDLSFDIKSSVADQKVVASVQQDDTWIELANEAVTTGTEWQTVNKTFKATTEGAVNLKFLLSDSSNAEYNVSLRNVSLKVQGAPYLSVKNLPSKLVIGAKFQIKAAHTVTVNPDYEVYTYTSSKPDVATVSETGMITAAAAGTTTIKVTSGAGAFKSFDLTVVTEAGANADTTQLAPKITTAETYLSQADKYSDQSLANLKTAVDAAKAIIDGIANGVIYDQPVVDAAMADIDQAIADLEDVTGTDKKALQACVDQYKNYKEKDYTPETWAVFEKALAAAQACLSKANATQKEVDAAIKRLENAADALKPSDNPVQPKEGLWIEEIEPQTYTGSAIKPEVRVWDGETPLFTEDEYGRLTYTSYKVTYKNNTKAGTATVTVKGTGNYTSNSHSNNTATFEIQPKDIGSGDIAVSDVFASIHTNGVLKNPKITAKYGKMTLKSGKITSKPADAKDYTFEYPDTTGEDGKPKAGHYDIILTGHGNFTGTRIVGYDVLANDVKLMSKAKVLINVKTVTYAGTDTIKPEVTEVSFGSGAKKETLNAGTDYTVRYVNENQVGKAQVVVEAKDRTKYYGSKSITYTVTGTALKANKLEITGIESSYPYTGSDIIVDGLIVKDKGKQIEGTSDFYTLVEGTDYELVYSKNRNVGKATVSIAGIGGYTGKVNKTFRIDKLDLETLIENKDARLEWKCTESAAYTKNGAVLESGTGYTLTFNGQPLMFKKDYTVTYRDHKKVSALNNGKKATITIKGAGNFKGTLTGTYDVTVPAGNTISAEAADAVKPAKASQLKVAVKLYEASTGKALTAGTDYVKPKWSDCYVVENDQERTITDADMTVDGVVKVRIALKGNYNAGTTETPAMVETTLRLYDGTKKASSFYVEKIPEQYYNNGRPIEPAVVVKKNRNETESSLKEGEDYSIQYVNNTRKGTAKVIITGIGNGYGGTKTVSFKIKAADISWAEEVVQRISSFFSNLF